MKKIILTALSLCWFCVMLPVKQLPRVNKKILKVKKPNVNAIADGVIKHLYDYKVNQPVNPALFNVIEKKKIYWLFYI